jgi:hypothetical protein
MHVIERHLELFQKQLEASQQERDLNIVRQNAAEMAALGLSLWEIFKSRLREQAPTETDEVEEQLARERRELVIEFDRAFSAVRRLADLLNARGSRLGRLEEISAASAEVSEMLAVPLDQIIAGHRQAREGKGRPAAEVRRDLHRRLHA